MRKLVKIGIGIVLGILWLQKPRFRFRKRVKPFTRVDYAHRGLHSKELPENTKAALKRAVEEGYGIEMDVRLCKDGLVIHHDKDLQRSAGLDLMVEDLTLEELAQIKVFGSEETISSLEEILEVIDGKIPLLLEIKSESCHFRAAEEVQKRMDQYQGDYLIESFQPQVLYWYRLHRPQVLRGQLSERKIPGNIFRRWIMGHLFVNAISRPDFLAYEKAGSLWVKLWRFLGTPTFVYTLRDPQEQKKYFDACIFEEYLSTRRLEG